MGQFEQVIPKTSFLEKLEATPKLYEKAKESMSDSEIIAIQNDLIQKERANAQQYLNSLLNFKALNDLKICTSFKRKISEKYAKKMAREIREQICRDFCQLMTTLLDLDWEHTRGCILCEQDLFIGEGTFLHPKPEDGDLGNNWGNRGGMDEVVFAMEHYTYDFIYRHLRKCI